VLRDVVHALAKDTRLFVSAICFSDELHVAEPTAAFPRKPMAQMAVRDVLYPQLDLVKGELQKAV